MGLMRRLRRSLRAPRADAVNGHVQREVRGTSALAPAPSKQDSTGDCASAEGADLRELVAVVTAMRSELAAARSARLSTVSLEEGPGCALSDDEFCDALAASLLHLETEDLKRVERCERERREQEKGERRQSTEEETGSWSPSDERQEADDSAAPLCRAPGPAAGQCLGQCRALGHPLAAEIDRVVSEQLALASADVADGWSLFAEQGEMRMYRLEVAADNRSVDPLKAVHEVRGVTARELCREYWRPETRLDWETTVDRIQVLARPDPSTVLCHQVHCRVWPAQQRDTVFWSHLCRRSVAGRPWSVVVNHSAEALPGAPRAAAGCVRATMTACLAGQDEAAAADSRAQLRTHVAYSSMVNPGGWAPTVALRLVYKREYPRFLQRFTSYVVLKSSDAPIEW
ncbi:ceramide transfer protein-like [Pollicipes pollicipes]|uniref:ceramide transfer protein-like n=1 Tax=Pollicipes pollicipes TaxID=41117 RepID=UPI001884F2B7|nr:ceramide transfer protein-like [Pollicipes pollicipes]